MWSKSYLGVFLFCVLASSGNCIPAGLPRYNQLGQGPPAALNNSFAAANLQLGYPKESTSVVPDFEYALLGQDPKDQDWYRVSLTPKTNKTGYRAQFATRKHPPFDQEMAHRHDKTIQDLLNWLDRAEDQSLWKVYRDLLGPSTEHLPGAKKIENQEQITRKPPCPDQNQQLLLVGDEATDTTTSTSQPPNDDSSKTANNFVYFIKGLK
ncbi:uncharacterized protein [Drosophila bipectinata]|uniref:uncharacterized protein n=1 Tax=Drosophila bipectinata TaxID=42026 RepID=UPI0038B295C9